MNESTVAKTKRHRGVILQMLHTNHSDQGAHMDDLELWGLLQDLNFELGQNQVLTLLQDLEARKYIRYAEKKNRINGRTMISRIELLPAGVDLIERIKEDPAVLIP